MFLRYICFWIWIFNESTTWISNRNLCSREIASHVGGWGSKIHELDLIKSRRNIGGGESQILAGRREHLARFDIVLPHAEESIHVLGKSLHDIR